MSQTTNQHYILSINCGSSSIKSKLFSIPSSTTTTTPTSTSQPLKPIAEATVKNIGSKGEKVVVKVKWLEEGFGDDLEDGESAGDGGSVEYASLPPLLLEKLTKSSSKIKSEQITHIAHRVVHGGPHKKPIKITKEHTEGLSEMDKLSEFAPLHNHSAVLAIKACLDALPTHTSILLFDTLFHQTLPKEVYTYAIPKAEEETAIPLRKYGFHGLSYQSILSSMAKELGKAEEDVSIVVAHLGSGGSSCCIRKGKSIDTSMGLTPLEGLVGGTRSGTTDPTLIFHLIGDAAGDAGIEGMKVTKAEATLNKKSGLTALAGTANFGTITTRLSDPLTCSTEEAEASKLAYDVYLDRLMGFLSSYLSKLCSTLPKSEIDGLVFSGGIGEKSDYLRADVAKRLEWMGAKIDEGKNKKASGGDDVVANIGGGELKLWVVQTDEEEVCAKMCREECGL